MNDEIVRSSEAPSEVFDDRPVGFVKHNGCGEIVFRQAGHPSNDPEPPWRAVYLGRPTPLQQAWEWAPSATSLTWTDWRLMVIRKIAMSDLTPGQQVQFFHLLKRWNWLYEQSTDIVIDCAKKVFPPEDLEGFFRSIHLQPKE